MTQLYKLTEQYHSIANMATDEYITEDEVKTTLAGIKDEIESKIESIGKLVLTLQANAEVVKIEKERLDNREKALRNNVLRLKEYLLTEMLSAKIDKVKRDLITVSVAKNLPSIEVWDQSLIPDKYIRTEYIPMKQEMLDHFNQTGEVISGTRAITNRKHIRIR